MDRATWILEFSEFRSIQSPAVFPLSAGKQGNECSRSRTRLPPRVAFLFTKRISGPIPVNGRAAFRAHRAVVCQFTTGVCNLQHPFGRLLNSVVILSAAKNRWRAGHLMNIPGRFTPDLRALIIYTSCRRELPNLRHADLAGHGASNG